MMLSDEDQLREEMARPDGLLTYRKGYTFEVHKNIDLKDKSMKPVVSWLLLSAIICSGMAIGAFILCMVACAFLAVIAVIPWRLVIPCAVGAGIGTGISGLLLSSLLTKDGVTVCDLFN